MTAGTHGNNHAPGARLSPGFCESCDYDRTIDRLTALADRLATRLTKAEARLAAVRAIVNPPCTCPGACSGPPRKVRADDIRAALESDGDA